MELGVEGFNVLVFLVNCGRSYRGVVVRFGYCIWGLGWGVLLKEEKEVYLDKGFDLNVV